MDSASGPVVVRDEMTKTSYWYFERFGEPEAVMRRGDQTLSEAPAGQVIVAIRAIGLNRADYRYVLGKHFPPDSLPSCVGTEAVGEIVEMGPAKGASATGRWKVGDRVALIPMLVDPGAMGVLRQFGAYDQSALLPVPDTYSDKEGAAYWTALLTTAGAMDMAGLGPGTCKGKTIVFTAAAGGVGTLGLQLARAWGAETLATTRNQEKVHRLSALAAQVSIVETAQDLARAVRERLGERGADAIFDPIGGDFIARGIDALARGGQFVSYEVVSGRVGTYDILDLMEKDASLHGFTIFRLLRHPGLLERLIRIGLEFADKATPILAASPDFSREGCEVCNKP